MTLTLSLRLLGLKQVCYGWAVASTILILILTWLFSESIGDFCTTRIESKGHAILLQTLKLSSHALDVIFDIIKGFALALVRLPSAWCILTIAH